MAPSRDISELAGKLKAENGVEEVKMMLRDLVDALGQDPTIATSKSFLESGSVCAVIDTMRRLPQEIVVQGHGCAILCYILRQGREPLKEAIHSAGGIPQVIAAIKNFTGDYRLRCMGLHALNELLDVDPDAVAESFPLLLRVLEVDDHHSQRTVCDIFRRLVVFGANRSACSRFLADAGGVPILLACLKRIIDTCAAQPDHHDGFNRNLLLEGTSLCIVMTLAHLFHHVDISNDFVNERGFEVIVDVMRTYVTYRHQEWACAILSRLRAFPQQMKTTIGAVGGVELVVKALSLFNTVDTSTQFSYQYAICALYALCKENTANVVAAQKAGGVGVLVEAVRKFFLDKSLSEKGKAHTDVYVILVSLIIESLGENDDNFERAAIVSREIIECGGTAAIVLSMEQFADDDEIQTIACKLLAMLSSENAGGAVAVVVDGGKSVLKRAQSHHTGEEDIQKYAKAALLLLSAVDDADRCHKCFTKSGSLMHCGRCQKVFYCSRDCQRQDYNVHKKMCKLTAYQNKGTK